MSRLASRWLGTRLRLLVGLGFGIQARRRTQTPQGDVSYTYDLAGRRISMAVNGQPTVNYTWDKANRLTAITQGSNSVGFSYDAANRRTQLTLPNGIVVAYTYDADSRITAMNSTMAGTQVGDLEYTYDKDGRVIAKSGSLASLQLPASVTGNTFNADNEMTSFNGTTMTYDADGNLTSDGTNSYIWSARDHLVALAGTNVAAYQYDAFGRRVQNTLNGVMTQYLYDGLNPVEEMDGSSPPNVIAAMLTGLGIDQYFARTDSNGTMSYLTDALGSTLALTNSSGAITTQYTYDPFGNTTVSGSSTNPFQFTGQANDGTGLYYYRARYYSPTLGRFISQDPLGFVGSGVNVYAYAANSPLVFVDPLGLYFDFNFSFGEGLVFTAGVQWDSNGISVYDGGGWGFGIPVSVSLTHANGCVSPGWQSGFQLVGPGLAAQVGEAPDGPFFEWGLGFLASGSLTTYRVTPYLYRFHHHPCHPCP